MIGLKNLLVTAQKEVDKAKANFLSISKRLERAESELNKLVHNLSAHNNVAAIITPCFAVGDKRAASIFPNVDSGDIKKVK